MTGPLDRIADELTRIADALERLSPRPVSHQAPTVAATDDAAVLAMLRRRFGHQVPSINVVQRLAGGGRARAVRLRGLHIRATRATGNLPQLDPPT